MANDHRWPINFQKVFFHDFFPIFFHIPIVYIVHIDMDTLWTCNLIGSSNFIIMQHRRATKSAISNIQALFWCPYYSLSYIITIGIVGTNQKYRFIWLMIVIGKSLVIGIFSSFFSNFFSYSYCLCCAYWYGHIMDMQSDWFIWFYHHATSKSYQIDDKQYLSVILVSILLSIVYNIHGYYFWISFVDGLYGQWPNDHSLGYSKKLFEIFLRFFHIFLFYTFN